MNQLSKEQSPYLLQHKDNPVNWYAWGDAAFAAARAHDKPIFLSIGYATCHWCHVMAHESFEDAEVAEVLNRDFISVKVDREERPDVDHLYMSVSQIMTGSGGWPLSILMTPDKKPFFAATYIPKESRFNSIGFKDLLQVVSGKWRNQRDSLNGTSDQISKALEKLNANEKPGIPGADIADTAFQRLAQRFDPVHGGFSQGTKFPSPHTLLFLIRYYQRTGVNEALEMAEKTLQQMRAGGIFDHIGFGFHRYATDSEWLVPHFEKMLYDQAMLILAYTEAFEATQNPLYARVVHEIVTYVKTRMVSPEGAFYSAEDADSEGVEGKYYVWTQKEIAAVLDDAEVAAFGRDFNIHGFGNFESHQTPPGTNIPHLKPDSFAEWMAYSAADGAFDVVRKKLLAARGDRVAPLLDDKILTDWNGLMIGALAKAGRVLHQSEYIEMAQRAAGFIQQTLCPKPGTLLHRYRSGSAAISGQLDDYAFLMFGVIELYQATFDSPYLSFAMALHKTVQSQFSAEDGAYYLSSKDAADLIVRPKEFFDGAAPSGNSMMYENLVRLSRLLGDEAMAQSAHLLAGAFFHSAKRTPDAHTHFLLGLMFALGPSLEIVIACDNDDAQSRRLLDAATAEYFPNRVILLKSKDAAGMLSNLAPYTASQTPIDGIPTAYVCTENRCTAPVTTPALVRERILSIVAK